MENNTMGKNDKMTELVKDMIESGDSPQSSEVKQIFQTLIEIANEEFPLPIDLRQCNTEYAKTDALFYAISSILSNHLSNYELLEAATEGMMSANEHSNAKKENSLCIAATGGEKIIRTLYVTIPVGIICSLFIPTIVQGNRAVTGCGCGGFAESDMMECLEYPLYLTREQGEKQLLSSTNFYYAHAQTYHPILRRFARERGVIGFRDIFKIAACLSDPFRCEYQYLCVWKNELVEISAKIFSKQNHIKKAVVSSGEFIGYDEFPVAGGNLVMAKNNEINEYELTTNIKENDLDLLGPENDMREESESIRKILDPDCMEPKIFTVIP